jgi:hypothetical protein
LAFEKEKVWGRTWALRLELVKAALMEFQLATKWEVRWAQTSVTMLTELALGCGLVWMWASVLELDLGNEWVKEWALRMEMAWGHKLELELV